LCSCQGVASGAGEAGSGLKRKHPASGVGKHAAEHMTQSQRKRKQPEVRLREGREAFRGQKTHLSGPRGRPQRQSPGQGRVKMKLSSGDYPKAERVGKFKRPESRT
jgi:hypothetical protein